MEWFVARRYLRGKRKVGFLISALGVLLGTCVLIIALSIANGFEKEVRDRIVGTLAHARVMQFHSRPILDAGQVIDTILTHPEVIGAAPFVSGKGVVELDKVQDGVIIMGIDSRLEHTVTELGTRLIHGELVLEPLLSRRERLHPGVVLGIGLADKLGVRPGAEIVLMSIARVEGGIDPSPTMGRFTVSGIFETGMHEYDLNLVYISIPSAQRLFGNPGVEGIQLRTTDMYRADRIADEVVGLLGGYPYWSTDWKAQNRTLFEWMKLEKFVIFFVISLIMLVAAFNIVSSLIVMILEKWREIGILMGMGCSSGAIMRIFIYCGCVVGLAGSLVGTVVGTLLCLIQQRWQFIPIPGDIYFISRLPVYVNTTDVVLVFVVANIVCWCATLYPAWKASKVLPAESMRFE